MRRKPSTIHRRILVLIILEQKPLLILVGFIHLLTYNGHFSEKWPIGQKLTRLIINLGRS